jgi:hypothetical protein
MIEGLITAISKKGKENEWYFYYCAMEMRNKDDGILAPFFWTSQGEKHNICTSSEMGRLLLTGWYYNIQDWAKNVCGYVYKSYHRKTGKFNDLIFAKAVKQIRENVGYYYHNEPQLKLFVVQSFFNDELKQLLPPKPKELERAERGENFFKEWGDNLQKKYKGGIRRRMWDLDFYADYLAEQLDNYGIPYMAFSEWKKKDEEENNEYSENLNKLEKQYNDQLLNINTDYLLT